MKKINLRGLILLIVLSYQAKSQDLHFSQLSETPMLINPANTGFFGGYFRAAIQYRDQWASMGSPYKTMGLSVDGNVFRNRKKSACLGLGLTIFNDKAGAANISNTNINFNVSGIVKMNKKSILSLGVYGGASINKANYNALTYESQFNGTEIDPNLPSNESVHFRSFTNNDIGAGLAYEYSTAKINQDRDDIFSFRLGAAAYHLNRPIQDFGTGINYRMPIKYVGSLFVRIDVPGSKISVLPSMVYYLQGPATEINLGTFVKYRFKNGTKVTGQKVENGFAIGAYYRVNDAIIPQLLLDMGTYAIGLGYDVNISSYRTASKTFGGVEISLRYNKLADALFTKRSEYRN
ncbi:MAG: PorP/SprF family type IX secretion system membrane protein [Bacteroidia bacterium]